VVQFEYTASHAEERFLAFARLCENSTGTLRQAMVNG
jgi:hypothetical protein